MSNAFDSATGTVSEPNSNTADRNLNRLRENEASVIADAEIAPQAIRYAMSIVRRWSDAEEIVQEAFCRLIQSGSIRSEHVDSDGRAILFATVRNLSVDLLRKQGRRKYESIDVALTASTPFNENELRLQQLESGVQDILKQMPREWADAIQLKMNGNLSYTDIAQVLDATHAQVRTWIFRARKQMAKDLRQRGLLEDGVENE